jgi:hypothetical protein
VGKFHVHERVADFVEKRAKLPKSYFPPQIVFALVASVAIVAIASIAASTEPPSDFGFVLLLLKKMIVNPVPDDV